ncbi:MFS transporter [Micromonospora sp. SH-82]|uniref:MFS transporter n=1 Tax=Micromonospora sp. SH-82 TaxID=3132938 RepID=UPI003EBC3F3C
MSHPAPTDSGDPGPVSSAVGREPTAASARLAAAGIFLMVGVMLGTWFARIPQLRTHLDLSYGQLGTVLFAQMVGVLAAMQVAGHLTGRLGSRTMIRRTALFVPWFLPLLTVMPDAVTAVVAMFCWGVVAGMLDISMNAHGVEVERAARRPVLNSLHAAWAVGSLVGAASATLAVRWGVSLPVHYTVLAVLLCGLAVVSSARLLPSVPVPASTPKQPRARLWEGWTRQVLVLGGIGASVAFCEGAVSSWSGVYLQEKWDAGTLASLAYTTYAVAQTVTRLVGDRLHDRVGAVPLVRAGVLVTVVGVLCAVAMPSAGFALLGFALQGAGLAVLAPIVAGAVGHGSSADGSAAATSLALARYSTVHYGGMMAGPPIVGWLAEVAGIGTVLWLLLVPLGVVGVLAAATAPASRARSLHRVAT